MVYKQFFGLLEILIFVRLFPVAKDEEETGAGGKREELISKRKGKGTKRGIYNLEWVKKGCRTGETVKNENLNKEERRRKRGKGN